MATVNLSWTVEGLHDGIRVERKFEEHVDYLDTLPAGTTEFEDDFSISALAEHYGVEPENLNLLTYTLTTFRGDKEKSTVVPVPVEDSNPQWLQDIIDNLHINPLPLVAETAAERYILNGGHVGILLEDSYGWDTIRLYVSRDGSSPTPHRAVVQEGDYSEEESYFPEGFDYSLLHDVDFTRILNQEFNDSHLERLYKISRDPMFEDNTYVASFALPSSDVEDSTSIQNAINNGLLDNLPTRDVESWYFLSAPFVASFHTNDSLTGMSIWVIDPRDTDADNIPKAKIIPWIAEMEGLYVYCVDVAVANGFPSLS